MAAVSGSFTGSKLVALPLPKGSQAARACFVFFRVGVVGKGRGCPQRTGGRGGGLSFVRCDVASASDAPTFDMTSVSALEQLKASAVDRYTKERSIIVVIGLSIHTTPDEMREKLAIPEAE